MVAPKQPKVGASTATSDQTTAAEPTVGKVTQVEQQYGTGNWEVTLATGQHLLCTPNLSACLNAPRRAKGTYLDPLIGTSREEVEQLIAARRKAGQVQVCGTLPLGGAFFGTADAYARAVSVDQMQIQLRTLQNMETSVLVSLQVSVMRLQGQDNARILNASEAMVLLTSALGAAVAPSMDRARPAVEPTKEPRERMTQEPAKPRAPKPPPPAPAEPEAPVHSELPKIELRPQLTRPSRGPTTPIKPGVLIPKSQRQPRDKTLVDDLKLRSVPTLRDGNKNPEFDSFTPSFIAGHFTSEQRRTGSDDPRDWRAPKGYEAQHPNGRPWAKYGEPPGTKLTWGTIHDNRSLQKPREFKQNMNAKPKPLPDDRKPEGK